MPPMIIVSEIGAPLRGNRRRRSKFSDRVASTAAVWCGSFSRYSLQRMILCRDRNNGGLRAREREREGKPDLGKNSPIVQSEEDHVFIA